MKTPEALDDPPDVASSCGFGAWERIWGETEYEAAVDRVRAAIERGDVYQVNLVQHLSAPCPGSPREVARTLAAALAP
jgi:para-aminobenzoate synthetase component I